MDDTRNWKAIAAFLRGELHKFDPFLSEANVPISARKLKAFDVICGVALEFSDFDAFRGSVARGAFHVIIEDWYRNRYRDAVDEAGDSVFVSMALVHGTPFAMRVPKVFTISSDEPNAVWVGFPASVQVEEDPLRWIQNEGMVKGLSDDELGAIRNAAWETANLIRSIGFDLRPLEHDEDLSIAALAGSVRSDLQSSARNLCERNEAALRSSAWDASQATEKALKLLIRQKRRTPPYTHDLCDLAVRAENLGAKTIDRIKLKVIPSRSDATNIRYEGDITLSQAVDVYGAALIIIRQIVFEAKRDNQLNFREGRIKIRRPSFFDFDTDGFSKQLRSWCRTTQSSIGRM